MKMHDVCPRCGANLSWQEYTLKPGAVVKAKCVKLELKEKGCLKKNVELCSWEGRVERQTDYSMKVIQ